MGEKQMANLDNGKVIVDVARNESRTGDSGKRARKATSAYLIVGGSSFDYAVTISTAGAHFCKVNHTGDPCRGNLTGKARKYGSVHVRDRNDPAQWCKHVSAALASPELIAEAQEITASAFGATPVRKPEPKPEPIRIGSLGPKTLTVTGDARKRLAELEAEREALTALVVTDAVRALVDEHGADAVRNALDSVA